MIDLTIYDKWGWSKKLCAPIDITNTFWKKGPICFKVTDKVVGHENKWNVIFEEDTFGFVWQTFEIIKHTQITESEYILKVIK